jgi:hypothetical protein
MMGFAFPTGMKLVAKADDRPTPWFWGVNGAAGVLAGSLAVGTSIAFGINTSLIVGASCYVLLIPAAFGLIRIQPSARTSEADEQGAQGVLAG